MRFAATIATLRRHGYRGWMAVEPVFEPDGEAAAARAAGYVQGIIETLGAPGQLT